MRPKLFLFFAIFNVLYLNYTSGQTPCTATTFTKSYLYYGGGSAHFIRPLSGNTYLLGGNINNRLSLIRITENGDTLWTRQSTAPLNGFMSDCVVDTDGNPWVAYNNDLFVKLDLNGNVLQSVKAANVQSSFAFVQMLMAPNGDKIVCYNNSNWTEGYVFVRYAPDFSVVRWAKSVEAIYPADINVAKMVLDGDKLVIAGHLNQPNSSDPRATIWQLDANTGAFIRKTSFLLNGEYLYPVDIQKHANGYIVQAKLYMGSTAYTKDVHTIIRVDTALNISSAYYLTGVNNHYSVRIRVQPDGSFYGAETSSWENFFFVDNADSVQWRNAINGNMISKNVTDMLKTDANLFSLNVSNYYLVGQNVNEGYFSVSKTDLQGRAQTCYTQYRFFGKQPIAPAFVTIPASIKDTAIVITTVQSTFLPLNIRIKSECSAIATCNALTIIGDTTVCTTNQFKLTGRRNAACNLPVSWAVIGGSPVSHSSVNDSTVTFSYTQSGNYTIVARLTGGCNTITDTVTVHVSLPGSTSLGNDTTLCAGDSLVVMPSGNFTNFQWQDGSLTSSFTVKATGTYFYEAQDYCHNTHRDTIIVTYHAKQHFTVINPSDKCAADTIKLSIPPSFTNVSWQPSTMAQTGTPNMVWITTQQPGMFRLFAKDNNNCTVADSMNILIKPAPLVDLGSNSRTICSGDVLTLATTGTFIQYNWNTGSSAPTIDVSQAGSYWLKATAANGCSSSDTTMLAVSPLPVVDLGNDVNVCTGNTVSFSAPATTGNTYRWQDGSNTAVFTTGIAGRYFVSVTNAAGCSASDTVNILRVLPLPSGFLPRDTSLCPNYTITIAPAKKYASYIWNTGSNAASVTVNNPGRFILSVTDTEGCKGSDTLNVMASPVSDCPLAIYFPNAFTPNKDGTNDVFKPKAWGILRKFHLQIFNRFGQMIFETTDVEHGWDGLISGIPQAAGTYVWQAVYQFTNEAERSAKGSLLLVR